MLSLEQKRQVFFAMRTENYLASLRLEGLSPAASDLPSSLILASAEPAVGEVNSVAPVAAITTVFADQM